MVRFADVETRQRKGITEKKPMVIETNAKLLTTSEAAEQLGISRRQIRTLIERDQLPAEKQGRDWFIRASDLRLVKERPKGRPEGAKDKKPRKASKKASRKDDGAGS
jgi:excisionase family DNA binding protein